MFSKFSSFLAKKHQVFSTPARAFRASPVLNKKLSLGEAVMVLEEKIASIQQVVSTASPTNILERPH